MRMAIDPVLAQLDCVNEKGRRKYQYTGYLRRSF